MFSILDYGAVADGKTLAREAFQRAVDACAEAGGGTVVVPAGRYLLGGITLRSHVHVCLEAGALILGSVDFERDYPPREERSDPCYQDVSHSYFEHSLFFADDCADIGFFGNGTIDMQGVWMPTNGDSHYRTVKMFAFRNCRDISFRDLTLLRATDLAIYLAGCRNVRIHGLSMDVLVDAISPDCCQNVVISDCLIKSDDDAIVPKASYTLGRRLPCTDIAISNCVISSNASAIKLGTETNGDFRNITVTGCVIRNVLHAGIAIESVDGSHVDGVNLSNITMYNVATPLFIRLGRRLRGPEGTEIGSIDHVTISSLYADFPGEEYETTTIRLPGQQNIGPTALPFEYVSIIHGLPDHPIRNLTLRDVTLRVGGGHTLDEAMSEIPQKDDAYPEVNMFGWKKYLPCYGMLIRHCENLNFLNVRLETRLPDERPPIIAEDVTNFTEA